jgi:hypothetical protein
MKRQLIWILALVALLAGVLHADSTEGELRIILLLTQHPGPDMLNRIVGDIGATAPITEAWGRKSTLKKSLAPDTYTVVASKVEACAFKDCVPCPDLTRDVMVQAKKSTELVFRWNAKYDLVEKKWSCTE